jgi:hypothetical protein
MHQVNVDENGRHPQISQQERASYGGSSSNQRIRIENRNLNGADWQGLAEGGV